MLKRKFFICEHCGNIVGMVVDGKAPMTCCGEVMKELVPNTVDAAHEKHVPVVTIEGNLVHVAVGSVAILCFLNTISNGYIYKQLTAVKEKLSSLGPNQRLHLL